MNKLLPSLLSVLCGVPSLQAQRSHIVGLAKAEGAKSITSPPFYLVVQYVVGKAGSGVTLQSMYPCIAQKEDPYLATWSLEYLTVSGKVIKVKCQPPLLGKMGLAMIPTEENGKGFRVFNADGQLVGEQYFQPSEEPDFDLRKGDGVTYKHSLYIKGNWRSQVDRSARLSWDNGETWWGPYGEGATPTDEIPLPEEKMKKNPHPYVEVFLVSGLTVYHHMYIYDASNEDWSTSKLETN